MNEIDHTATDNTVCPYCGYEHELEGDEGYEGEQDCGSCERTFTYVIDYDPRCRTTKLDDYLTHQLKMYKSNLASWENFTPKDHHQMRTGHIQRCIDAIAQTEARLQALAEAEKERNLK